jgi:hypothetical protein
MNEPDAPIQPTILRGADSPALSLRNFLTCKAVLVSQARTNGKTHLVMESGLDSRLRNFYPIGTTDSKITIGYMARFRLGSQDTLPLLD